MPHAVLGSSSKATKFPFGRLLEVLRGDVRWLGTSGWCDRGLVEIVAERIEAPTVEQIQFVQQCRPYLGNYLQIREALFHGHHFGFGPLTKEEAEEVAHTFRTLSIPFRIDRSPIWRPLNYQPPKKPNQMAQTTPGLRPSVPDL